MSKVKELFNRLQADPRAAKASAGTSAESVVAKNPEFRKCEERIGQLKGELASLMSWGVSSLAAKEGGGEAARDLAAQLEARPVLVLPGGILGEHLAQAAVERRFLSPEELKKVELDLPFAGKEWRQTEEGARLRRIMANIMREFEGSIVEAAKDQIPVDFPGIASPGQPLHPQGRADAIFEELRHILLLCQYATATGTPSFTDPEVRPAPRHPRLGRTLTMTPAGVCGAETASEGGGHPSRGAGQLRRCDEKARLLPGQAIEGGPRVLAGVCTRL